MDGPSLTGWPHAYDRRLWDLVQQTTQHSAPDFGSIANQLAAEARSDRFLRQCVHIDPDPFSRDLCKVHYDFLQRQLSAYRDRIQAERPSGFSIFDTSNLAVRLKTIYEQMKSRIPGLSEDSKQLMVGENDDDHDEPILFGLEGPSDVFNPFPCDDDEFVEFRANFNDLPECDLFDHEGDCVRGRMATPGSDPDDDSEFWTHTRLSIGTTS